MATHQLDLSLNECNTPWWYETPSLASQSTFSSNTYCTGTSQIDPFDITPSQSSGYYDEDTTISEASSNLFMSGVGSCATCSEWTRGGGGDGRHTSTTSARPGSAHARPSEDNCSTGGGGNPCEHCGYHGAREMVSNESTVVPVCGRHSVLSSIKSFSDAMPVMHTSHVCGGL